MENMYEVLIRRTIIDILDGDTTFGSYTLACGERTITIGLPYLSGAQIIELSTKFGYKQSYTVNGGTKSRWIYLTELLKKLIQENRISQFLSYIFSERNIMKQYKNIHEENQHEIYLKVIETVILDINKEFVIEKKELAIENRQFVIRTCSSEKKCVGIFEEDIKPILCNEQTSIGESELCVHVLNALQSIQKTPALCAFTENQLNDIFRNSMCMIYKNGYDQTRQGISAAGKDAGNIDFQISDEKGISTAIFEAMILNKMKKEYIDKHIKKVLNNYDPIGCPYAFIIVYAKLEKFDEFWDDIRCYFDKYNYFFEKIGKLEDIIGSNDGYRHAKICLKRRGLNVALHYFVIHLKQ